MIPSRIIVEKTSSTASNVSWGSIRRVPVAPTMPDGGGDVSGDG